jgi:adhesin transport system outer membrane protein
VRSAVNTNPALDVATFETRATAYELLQLKSEYQPRVSVFANVGAQRVDDPVSLSAADNDDTKIRRELGVNLDYVIFDGYRRANQIYTNAARLDANIYRLLDAAETLALNATEVYIDVVRHLRLQQAAQANLVRHRQIRSRVREQVDAGRLPVSDLLQADDRVRAAELALIEVRQAGRDAEARYKRIIGHPRKGSVSITLAKKIPRSHEALLSAARENSFRIRVAGI